MNNCIYCRKKNTMKKILILLLVLSVILGTAACGAASKEPEATPIPATEAPVPAEAAPAPEATPEPVPETTPEPTPEATPEPTPTPSPAALLGPVISVSGERYPETLTAGKKFGIKGIVSASSGVLTEVYAKVTDSNGKIAISSQIYRPNKPTLDIHETINNDLSFGQLGAGTYTYTVTATADDSGRKTTTDILVRQFTVKEYAAAPIADEECRECVWLPMCVGGCPHKRLFDERQCVAFRNDPEKYVLALHARIGENKGDAEQEKAKPEE